MNDWIPVLHRGGRHAIHQVFVGGRLVVDDGKVITVDRDAVMAEIGAILQRPETAMETEAWAAIGALMPHLEAHHKALPLVAGHRSYRYNKMADDDAISG